MKPIKLKVIENNFTDFLVFYDGLSNFCPFCGSTKIEKSEFHCKCSACKSIFNKRVL